MGKKNKQLKNAQRKAALHGGTNYMNSDTAENTHPISADDVSTAFRAASVKRAAELANVMKNPSKYFECWDLMLPFDEIKRFNKVHLLLDTMKHLNVPLDPKLLLNMSMMDLDGKAVYEFMEVIQDHFTRDPEQFEKLLRGEITNRDAMSSLGHGMALGVAYGLMLSEHMSSTRP